MVSLIRTIDEVRNFVKSPYMNGRIGYNKGLSFGNGICQNINWIKIIALFFFSRNWKPRLRGY